VLWATHLFDEVESKDDLVVIDKGRVVARGDVAAIEKETGSDSLAEAFRRLTGHRVEEVAA
jgi:ABC-2 type transport system ATP-binding protein